MKEKHTLVSADIYIDVIDSNLCSRYGIDISPGWNTISFSNALELIRSIDRALTGGVIYVRNQKRMRSTMRQIVFAFGPDMEELIKER